MELQFQKKDLRCLHRLARQIQNQEQTQELRLPDGMPDIGRVIAGRGQPIIRNKQWGNGSVSVSGGVMVWVLYQPEEAEQPQCIEAWLPFQMKWEIPATSREGNICVQPFLTAVDARATSSRKLMIRAGVSLLMEATVEDTVELYAPTDDLPADVQLLQQTYPMLLPTEAGERSFFLEEQLALPGNIPPLEKLAGYSLSPSVLEEKVLGDKVIFRGTAQLQLLYMSGEGRLCGWSFDIPFSQYAELSCDYSAEADCRVVPLVTSLEVSKLENGEISWKVGLSGQYQVCERMEVKVVEDAYSPVRDLTPQTIALTLPAILEEQTRQLQPEVELDAEALGFVDPAVFLEYPRTYREDGAVTAQLQLRFQTVQEDAMGQLLSDSGRWEQELMIPAADSCTVFADLGLPQKLHASPSGVGTAVRCELPLRLQTVSQASIPMVTGITLENAKPQTLERPSLVLRRAGEESVWSLAKKTGSTVEAIRKANSLQQEPLPEQLLLIPITAI